jgi:Fur family transcriptional regulator, ferric uptake regulator
MSHCHTLLQALHHLGYRITPQREMIVEAIAHSGGHATAEEIYDQVKVRTQAVNLATVYRTLDLLVEKGLASRANLWDGRVVYATMLHGPHIHLVCRQCGAISLADSNVLQSLEAQLLTSYDFTPDLQHLSIVGLCAGCRSTGDKNPKGL